MATRHHQLISTSAVSRTMLPLTQRNNLNLINLMAMFDDFPLGIVMSEDEEHCLYRNPAYQLMIGLDAQDPELPDKWHQRISDKHIDFNSIWHKRLNGLNQLHIDVKMQRCNGEMFLVRILGVEIQLTEQRMISIFMFEDISERILISNALLEAQQQLSIEKVRSRIALDSVCDAVITVNLQSEITYLNIEAEVMTGWSRKMAIGQPLVKVFKIIDAETRFTATSPTNEAMKHNHKIALQHGHLLINKQGEEIEVEDCSSPVHDNYGEVIGAVLVFHHVMKSKAMINKLTKQAWYDFLTSLPNFALFRERLIQAIAMAERHQRRMAVLFLDIDGFKNINDSLGHLSGDLLLKSVATKLKTCVRHTDTVCRRSGDEFLILLAEIEQDEDAIQVAEQILSSISESCELNGTCVNLTVSIGISVFPDESSDFDKLLHHSDNAMYEAKRRGKNRYFYAGNTVRS